MEISHPQEPQPETPDLFLAAALERAAERHEAGHFGQIGAEYDQVEMETLPSRNRTSPRFDLAFRFWDGWVDASNHGWLYYDGIGRDDWPLLAREVAQSLREGVEPSSPVLWRYFGQQPPGLLKRLWSRVRGVNRSGIAGGSSS